MLPSIAVLTACILTTICRAGEREGINALHSPRLHSYHIPTLPKPPVTGVKSLPQATSLLRVEYVPSGYSSPTQSVEYVLSGYSSHTQNWFEKISIHACMHISCEALCVFPNIVSLTLISKKTNVHDFSSMRSSVDAKIPLCMHIR